MIVVIYEDNFENFYPLINLYPQFYLRIGMKTIAENIVHYFPQAKIYYIARDVFKLKKPPNTGPRIYLSGRFLMTKKFPITKNETKLSIKSDVIGFIKNNPPFPNDLKQIKKTLKSIKKTQRVFGNALNHVWDLIKYNEAMLFHHFKINKEKTKIFKKML
jgi:hypothetical protein